MKIIMFSLAGGMIAALVPWIIYSYVYPLILAKILLAAFLRMLD